MYLILIVFIFLKGIIKEVVKMVFETQVYADKDELRVAVEAYLNGNHAEYFYFLIERVGFRSMKKILVVSIFLVFV